MRNYKTCATCKYWGRDANGDMTCGNNDSDLYGDWIEYNHVCDCWEAEV